MVGPLKYDNSVIFMIFNENHPNSNLFVLFVRIVCYLIPPC